MPIYGGVDGRIQLRQNLRMDCCIKSKWSSLYPCVFSRSTIESDCMYVCVRCGVGGCEVWGWVGVCVRWGGLHVGLLYNVHTDVHNLNTTLDCTLQQTTTTGSPRLQVRVVSPSGSVTLSPSVTTGGSSGSMYPWNSDTTVQ